MTRHDLDGLGEYFADEQIRYFAMVAHPSKNNFLLGEWHV
jgi:hypothetical protein